MRLFRRFFILVSFVALVGCADSDSGSGMTITPEEPVNTFPVMVGFTSYDFPVESSSWKYAISDNISNYYRDNSARASYIVETLGKAGATELPNAYIRVGGYDLSSHKFDNYIYIWIYSANKDKLLYYASLEPSNDNSPATLYNSIVNFAIFNIKNYPMDSYSGVVELPY